MPLDDELTRYLIVLSGQQLNPKESEVLTKHSDSSRDLRESATTQKLWLNLTDHFCTAKGGIFTGRLGIGKHLSTDF